MAEHPHRILIVGAGPAGAQAAIALAQAGLRPILIDEAPRIGGQIYRQPPAQPGFLRTRKELYGDVADRAQELFGAFDQVRASIDYWPGWSAVDIGEGTLIATDGARSAAINWDRLVLATGATDRIIPCPGWTLPGVFTLGAAQIALKYQGCAIGRRAIFAGTGPLLFLAAYQYARVGAPPCAIVTTATRMDMLRALRGLRHFTAEWWGGAKWLAYLASHRVPIYFNSHIRRILGETRVFGAEIAQRSQSRLIECDAVALGYGLRSETQLAELAGARFHFDEQDRQFLPDRDELGRLTGLDRVYAIGDGAGILGAQAASAAGRLAAGAILEDLGLPAPSAFRNQDLALVARWRSFQLSVQRVFRFPASIAANLADEAIVCRCEMVQAGDLRLASTIRGIDDINKVKALTRLGMGRCQGRMCSPAASEILAAKTGRAVSALGRLRCQPPIKPLPVDALALRIAQE